MKPISLPQDIRLYPQRRELGTSSKRKGLRVWIPEEHCELLELSGEDAVIFSVWEREDGARVLVVEKDKLGKDA